MTTEKPASEMTVEDWEKQFIVGKIDSIAATLERLAEDVRREKDSLDSKYFTSYTRVVGQIIHDVTWGVTNLSMDAMLRGSLAADLDRESRAPKKDDE